MKATLLHLKAKLLPIQEQQIFAFKYEHVVTVLTLVCLIQEVK